MTDAIKRYKTEKVQKTQNLDPKKLEEIEKEWDKNEEQIFLEIFGKSFQEAPDLFYDEKNQNLREIYEEEMEKLFNKKFSYIFSAEEKFKEKISEAQIKNPAKSTDKNSAKERFFKIFKKWTRKLFKKYWIFEFSWPSLFNCNLHFKKKILFV